MDQFTRLNTDLLLCYNGYDAAEKDEAEEQCKHLVDKITTLTESGSLNPENLLKERWCKEYSIF